MARYYASGTIDRPVVKISAIYHRDDPIITGDPPLKTYLNTDMYKYVRAANIWSSMERAGIPDVRGVWFPRQGRFVVTVAIRQRYAGHARQVGHGVPGNAGRRTRHALNHRGRRRYRHHQFQRSDVGGGYAPGPQETVGNRQRAR